MTLAEWKEAVLAAIARACREAFHRDPEGLEAGFPPEVGLGDFAVACFPLARQFRMSPAEIAARIAAAASPEPPVAAIRAAGPYLNVALRPASFFGDSIAALRAAGDRLGNSAAGAGRRVMVEYLSPNTNKPLHLGHLRNAALGIAIIRLLEATGHRVIPAMLINDRGVHICKSMLAWQRFAGGATPATAGMKGDHFVGKWYVRYAIEAEKDPSLEPAVQEMLQRWEAGDPEILALWKTMNGWVYEGFAETCRRFGMRFEVVYYESETYRLGKDVIADGLARGVFTRDERGNTVFVLPEKPFGREKDGTLKRVTVLRADGTSLYITQDIGTAIRKVTEHGLDSSVYVVGSEQEHHFQCLFAILEALGYPWARACRHLSYGMVYLPEGKMKSREGKVVDADDLIEGMVELAAEEIRRRDPEGGLAAEEIRRRAEAIGVGAIKFYLLRVRPSQSIHFDPAESISFDGFTGPYCQYAYARIFGILEKAAERGIDEEGADFGRLGNPEETLLLRHLLQFPEEIAAAAAEFSPARLAVHVFNTARAFNQFYNRHAVLQAETAGLAAARLALVRATALVLKRGLELLGLEVLETM